MRPPTPPTVPPVAPEVLAYARPDAHTGSPGWVTITQRALLWWLAGVGAAKMAAASVALFAVNLKAGPNAAANPEAGRAAFLLGLVACAVAAGVVTRSRAVGAILAAGAGAVAVADLAFPEGRPYAAGLPTAAGVAAVLLVARLLAGSPWGRRAFLALAAVGLGLGLLALLGAIAFALVGFRGK